MSVDWSNEQIAEKVYADMVRHAGNAENRRTKMAEAITADAGTYKGVRVEDIQGTALDIARDEAKIEALAGVYEYLTGANSFDTKHAVAKAAREAA